MKFTEIKLLAVAMLALMVMAPAATADCTFEATAVAQVNPDNPDWGYWKYTLDINWDNSDAGYGLSHWDLIFAPQAQACCDSSLFFLPDSVGVSTGEPGGCSVTYSANLECLGDPSIPGEEPALIKFEPHEGDCEPGAVGEGTFFFYSDIPPSTVTPPNDLLLFKADGMFCNGSVTGDLPIDDCDPLALEQLDWSSVKIRY